MSLAFFLARRIYLGGHSEEKASRPAIVIAMAGIAIGLAVMLIAVAIVLGFKREVRDKIVGFGSHIQLTNLDAAYGDNMLPLSVSDSLWQALAHDPEFKHVQRYSVIPGIVNTAESFRGMMLKGIGEEYDASFFRKCLVEGEIPVFSDSLSSNQVVISKSMADALKLKIGDKIDTYYVQNEIRVRRLLVAGIYESNFPEFDDLFMLTDLRMVNRLNLWENGLVSGIEIQLNDYDNLEEATFRLSESLLGKCDALGARYCVQNVEMLNPQVFAWLDILDINIWVILILMMGVAGFTMISGLLIIIIERTSMIGILKSLGADNNTVRRVFLWLSVFLIGKGMLWGNVLGVGLCCLQKYGAVFRLDPQTYYMDTVPVSLSLWWIVLLNAGALVISVWMLLGPSSLVTRIHPADSMRYE